MTNHKLPLISAWSALWFALMVALMAVLLLLASSCQSSRDKKLKPSALGAGLYSGQSLQSVERKLDMMAGSFEVLEERTPLASDTRPLYQLLVISKQNLQVYGHGGELVLTFFNDRLMASRFYASNVAAARAAVETNQGISLAEGEAHIQPSTRVWIGKDENGRYYIGWIDKSLQAEQDTWLKNYGQ